MRKFDNKQESGFTIIEVVLVLAIAGLIFLMVFIALPALQRSQRDAQRRQDASRFMAQLNQYETNNRGAVPPASAIDSFANSYLKRDQGEFKDPKTGANYTISRFAGGTAHFQYATPARCNGENIESVSSGSTRAAAVRIQLEGSGFFCQDNQG